MSYRLDPDTPAPPSRPALTEAAIRMADIQIALDVCRETRMRRKGARRRAASKHKVRQSTITECLKRVDSALGTALFVAGDDGHRRTLTPAGVVFADAGSTFLLAYQSLRRQVQRACDDV